jgi:UDP-2,3-diacylglucosamine pyrophosphatase LpxH
MNDKIVGHPIRCNRKTLQPRGAKPYAELMLVGDVHLGSPQFDQPRFLRQLDFILKNGLYVLLMGDLLEMATRTSVGAGVYEQDRIGQTQFEQMAEWLKPLAKKNLILGLLTGNHEERVYQATGVNVSKALARELGVSYLGDACWNVFRVGNQRYTVYSLHGRSGARFDGTALLALERVSTSFDADVVCMGHMHKCANASTVTQRVVSGRVKEFKKHLILTGGYVSYDGGYGQTAGLPISKLGSPKVKLFSNKHDVSISW